MNTHVYLFLVNSLVTPLVVKLLNEILVLIPTSTCSPSDTYMLVSTYQYPHTKWAIALHGQVHLTGSGDKTVLLEQQ